MQSNFIGLKLQSIHLVYLLIVFLLLWRIPYYGKFVLDDPFITFRYAKNLVEHGELVFNLGQYVLATTKPLYTLLMAGMGFLLLPIPLMATLINLLFEAITLYVFFRLIHEFNLSRRQSNLAFVVTGILYVSNRSMSIASLSGLETPLFTLLNVITILYILQRRYTLATVAASFATLARPDGIFALALVAFFVMLWERRLPISEILIGGMIGLPWAVVAFVTYGSFIPHSVTAKSAIESIWFSSLGMKLSIVFYEPLRFFGIFAVLSILWAVMQLIISEYRKQALVLLVFTGIHLGYMILPDNLGFDWYFAPLYTLLNILTGLGIAFLVQKPIRLYICLIGLALGVGYSSIGNYLSVAAIDRNWRDGVFQALNYLEHHASSSAIVQSTNIGIIGYYTDFRILDPYGLASPEVVPLMAEASDLFDLQVRTAAHFQPDYIVGFGIEEYPGYSTVAEFPISYTSIIIYQRQNEPVS